MVKHLMDWVTSLHELDSRIDTFNLLGAMMPIYSCFAQFNKPFSQVTHCSGNMMKALGCAIVPVVAATLLNHLVGQRVPFTEALLCDENCVYCHLMSQNG